MGQFANSSDVIASYKSNGIALPKQYEFSVNGVAGVFVEGMGITFNKGQSFTKVNAGSPSSSSGSNSGSGNDKFSPTSKGETSAQIPGLSEQVLQSIGKGLTNISTTALTMLFGGITNMAGGGSAPLPSSVQNSFNAYEANGWQGNVTGQTSGTSAGKTYRNDTKLLPTTDANGNAITYKEYDVNSKRGQTRDMERFVRGSDGLVYYTDNHYQTFTKVN